MMSLKGFLFAGLVGLSLVVGACESFLPEEDEDDDETGTPTNTATPTPSVAPTPVTTTDGDIVTIDWGTISLEAGESPHFDFTAPAGTISIDFMAIGAAADANKIFGFFSLSSPAGTVIDNSAGAPARQAFAEGAMSFSLPSDDSAITQVSQGNYRFHVLAFDPATDDFADTDPQVLVKIRTAPSGVPAGEIDVNVIVVDGVGITAAQACTAGNPVYDGLAYAAADDVDALYNSIGIVIGQVTCYELTPSTEFTDIGSEAELGALFETSAGIADQRINLYIVGSFSGQLGFAAGVAGSVPIPMQVNGTPRSGVAVQYNGSAAVMGETIAHEFGHSLGLYHTTEFDPATNGYDPIGDTPTCPGLTSPYSSGCTDDTNVMFPQLTGTFDSFTAGQATVIKPTVHIRRAGTPAFAPAATLVFPPPERLVWEGPPIRCRNGIASRDW